MTTRFEQELQKAAIKNYGYKDVTDFPFKQGARVIPSKCLSRETEKRLTWHPTPMRISHAKWLVKWWGEGGVIDPFAGSGTIGEACKELSIPFMGFEINEEYCKRANERIYYAPQPFC